MLILKSSIVSSSTSHPSIETRSPLQRSCTESYNADFSNIRSICTIRLSIFSCNLTPRSNLYFFELACSIKHSVFMKFGISSSFHVLHSVQIIWVADSSWYTLHLGQVVSVTGVIAVTSLYRPCSSYRILTWGSWFELENIELNEQMKKTYPCRGEIKYYGRSLIYFIAWLVESPRGGLPLLRVKNNNGIK